MRPKSAISHVLVALQFGAIIIIAWPFSASDGRLAWLTVSAVGIVVGLYTLAHNKLGNFGIYPEPVNHARLITSGPYRWVRHPMYTSLLLFMLGIALYRHAWPNYAGWVLLLIALWGKMQREENYLRGRFDDYPEYVTHTHRLLPGIY